MKMNRRLLSIAIPATLLGLACAASLYGQMGGMMGKPDLSSKMAENAQKLKQYTYTQKTEIFLKGELKGTKLASVHYDAAGNKIVTPANSEPAQAQQESGGRRGMLARVKEKKIEEKKDEIKDYVERLTGLMGQYLPPNPDRVKAAMPRAEITPPAGGPLKVTLPDYLKQGDKMMLMVEPSTKALSEVLVNSSLDQDPVSFQVNFAQLPDGTNYPSLTTLNSPAKDLRIQVSTSDYHK
jgi:hypothetical protein